MDGNLELAWTTIEILAFIGVMFGIVPPLFLDLQNLVNNMHWIVAIALLIWYFPNRRKL